MSKVVVLALNALMLMTTSFDTKWEEKEQIVHIQADLGPIKPFAFCGPIKPCLPDDGVWPQSLPGAPYEIQGEET